MNNQQINDLIRYSSSAIMKYYMEGDLADFLKTRNIVLSEDEFLNIIIDKMVEGHIHGYFLYIKEVDFLIKLIKSGKFKQFKKVIKALKFGAKDESLKLFIEIVDTKDFKFVYEAFSLIAKYHPSKKASIYIYPDVKEKIFELYLNDNSIKKEDFKKLFDVTYFGDNSLVFDLATFLNRNKDKTFNNQRLLDIALCDGELSLNSLQFLYTVRPEVLELLIEQHSQYLPIIIEKASLFSNVIPSHIKDTFMF